MKPIRSKRDLELARTSLQELREQLARLKKTYGHDRDAFDLATRGLRQLAHEAAEAIRAYEEADAGQLPPVVGSRNPRTGQLEIPRVLRRLRQAAGLDQTALAARLDTRQSDISRWVSGSAGGDPNGVTQRIQTESPYWIQTESPQWIQTESPHWIQP